jgi:mono/diheme cytochrome c family protein
VGHFFTVITDGYGAMYPFGSRISPADRWAIVAYIRALQFSQDAPVAELTDADRAALEKAK